MCPLLILANVPASKTGVFPERFLSWRGPKRGRSNPKRAVSPSISHDTTSSNLSTRRMGSHFSNHMDSPKVDFPSISCGSTCTCRCSVIQIKIKSYTHYGLWPWPTPSLVMGNLQKGSKYKNNKKERCMIMTMCVCAYMILRFWPMLLAHAWESQESVKIIKNFFFPSFWIHFDLL